MTPLPSSPGAARIAGAVFAGLLAVVVLSTATDAVLHATHVFPREGLAMSATLWWLAIAYRAVFTALGGWIAARLTPAAPMRAVWILAGIGTVLGLMGVAVAMNQPQMGPAWYAWGVAITGPLFTWLGGRLGAGSIAKEHA
jgi:hypothetical protein